MKNLQKGFALLTILLIAAGVLVVGGAGYWYYQSQNKAPELIGGQKDEHGCLGPAGYSWCEVKQKCLRVWEEKCEATAQIADWKSNAENTVSVFLKNVNTPGYGDNINIAFAQLTVNAQTVVKANLPNITLVGLSYGLASFVHVQEGPDKGTSIVSSEKLSDGTVSVVSQWNYSGQSTPSKRTFILVLENDQWKIDKVLAN